MIDNNQMTFADMTEEEHQEAALWWEEIRQQEIREEEERREIEMYMRLDFMYSAGACNFG